MIQEFINIHMESKYEKLICQDHAMDLLMYCVFIFIIFIIISLLVYPYIPWYVEVSLVGA